MPDLPAGSEVPPSPVRPGWHPPISPASLKFLGILAFLVAVAPALLNDPDTQWHVAVGRRIWQERSVPWSDAFSHTFAGAPWIAKEWLSQVVLYAAHALAGWPGVALAAALSIALSFALLHAWLQKRLHPYAVLVCVLVAFLLSAPHLLARPHILTLPVIVVWTSAIVDAADRRSAPPWWLPLVMALWANLHAGFTIGFVLAGVLAAESVVAAPRDRRRAVAAGWGVMLAASVVASCASPYGYRPLLVTFALFGSGEPLPYIGEWQPLAFDVTGWTALGALLLLCAVMLADLRRSLFRLVALGILGALMIRHVRFLDLFAIAAPVLAAGSLARVWPTLAAKNEHSVPARTSVIAGPALFAVVVAAGLSRATQPSPWMTPVAALRAAQDRGLTAGPVFNDYDFGGFLIERGVKTFIDGRTDQLFLGGFFRDMRQATRAADPSSLARFLAPYNVTWALVRPGSNEARNLSALDGWARVYGDATAEVFARR